MGIDAIGSLNSISGSSSLRQFDPAKMMEAMMQRFIKKSDTDGDGMLSSQEVSGLSSDAFKALDANGDGKLGADEIKSALQKAMDQMKQAFSSSDPQQTLSALKDSPEGQLMQLMRSQMRHHHGQQSQGQTSSIQITINQTIYNISGTSGVSQTSGNGVDLTA